MRSRPGEKTPQRRLGRALITLALLALALVLPAVSLLAQPGKPPPRPESITVVSDDNYPPYIFRNGQNQLQGILVDEWKAWERATGIRVDLRAMDWGRAQEFMQEGQADVIDTIFFNADRARLYDFTKPYAELDVPVFFHKSLGGITDVESLRGFTVGVKAGDAAIIVLQSHGISSLKEYDSYAAIIDAAREGDIRVFSIDAPPALYYLYKHGMESEYRQGFVLYTGEFHRAVRKGDAALLLRIEDGFAAIPAGELRDIREKWLGAPIARGLNLRLALYVGSGIAAVALALFFFNLALRRRVRTKTAELNATLGELRTSEERFRTIFNSVSDLIFLHAWPTGRIVDVNQRTCEVFGYTREEMLSLPVEATSSGVAPYDQAHAMELMRKAYEGTPQVAEWLAKNRNGRLFWLEVSIRRALVLGRELLLVSCRDIDERKRAEEAMKASENTLRSLFASMTDVILILDAGGRYLEIAPTNTDRLYQAPAELLGRTVSEVFPPEQAAYFLRIVRQTLETGATVSTDYRINIGGRECWFSGNVSPLTESSVIWVARDITERKIAENALFVSRERLQLALDAANDGLWDWRLDTGEAYFSPRYYTMLGYEPGEFAANFENFSKLLHPDDLAAIQTSIKTSLRDNETNAFEVRMRTKSGEWKWILTRSRVVDRDGDGAPTRLAGTHTDITERKMAEEALLASERRFSELIRYSSDSITILDREGMQIFVSDAVERMLGYKASELLNIPVIDELIHPDDQEGVKAAFAAILRDGMGGAQYRHRHKNGSWVHLEAWGTNQLENPDIRGVVVNVRDITERKRAEETLRVRESYLTAIIENQPGLVWLKDGEGRFLAVNSKFAISCGKALPEDLVGETDLDIWPLELAVKYRQDDKAVVQTGQPVIVEEFILDKGESRWFETFKMPVRDERGGIIGTTGYAHDITERKRAEEALRDSEERYRSVIQNMQDVYYRTDAEGRLIMFSPSLLRLLGYGSMDEVLGRTADSFYLFPEERRAFLDKLRTEGVLNDYEVTLRRKDGTPVSIATTSNFYHDKAGNVLGVEGIFRDISERKAAEEALTQARDAADAANRAKSDFLANMSHEIRTPLNGIVGMIQLLDNSELNEEQQRYSQAALLSSQRLTRLLGDILDLSRIEARKFRLELKPFVLAEVLDSAKTLFRLPAGQKGVGLSLRVDESLPKWLTGDEHRLRQVLFNLVGNAVKFTDSGEITVEVDRLGPESGTRCRVLFVVSDTGIGIAPELLAQSFQMFTQAEGSLNRNHQGAGLGLAIVRHLVGLMGGRGVDVSSEVGVGTTFSFVLPFDVPQPGTFDTGVLSEAQGEAPSLEGLRLLLVEDEEINQLALRTSLVRLGVDVTCVGDGEAALEALRGGSFDGILMDIQMPGMNGLEATQAIRTWPEFQAQARIPIIALTAFAMAGDRERFLAAGMDDYLAKPFNPNELPHILARIRREQR